MMSNTQQFTTLNGSSQEDRRLNNHDDTSVPFNANDKKRRWPQRPKRPAVEVSPLDEAAKLALEAVPAKTPVSILQELLGRRGASPQYELVQIEGAIHEPTFRYRVSVTGTHVAVGFGKSKKEAKHAAARNVLDKIIGNDTTVEQEEEQIAVVAAAPTTFDDKAPGNPIGTLQEMLMSRRWPPPCYTLKSEEGPSHERQFTITCTIFKYREVGNGRSKKVAKRQAAQKMLERMKDPNFVADEVEATESPETALTRFGGLKHCKISALGPPNIHKVASFHKALKASSGEKLNQLQMEVMGKHGFNCVSFLQEIGAEQHFEVTYVDVEECSSSGNYQSLVQLSTMPVAVCYGSGPTSKDAQASAAHNALEYLKIMTKK